MTTLLDSDTMLCPSVWRPRARAGEHGRRLGADQETSAYSATVAAAGSRWFSLFLGNNRSGITAFTLSRHKAQKEQRNEKAKSRAIISAPSRGHVTILSRWRWKETRRVKHEGGEAAYMHTSTRVPLVYFGHQEYALWRVSYPFNPFWSRKNWRS